MCKAIDEIYQNGIETGEARGEQKSLVEVYQEFGKTKEETIERFMMKFEVGREEAEEKVNEYWKEKTL